MALWPPCWPVGGAFTGGDSAWMQEELWALWKLEVLGRGRESLAPWLCFP